MGQERIAVLGTGIMGAPMVKHLLRVGFEVHVFNRSQEKCIPLAEAGAKVCAGVDEAVEGATVLLTVLSDGPATREVLREGELLAGLSSRAMWIQSATIGVSETTRLLQLAAVAEVAFVDAPLLGTRTPAEAGELVILASGAAELEARCAPIFEAVGARTHWLGEAGQGSRMKLVVNNWILGLLGALGETLSLARALELRPERFLEILAGGPLDSAYAQGKGAAMLHGDYEPSFPLRHALKDARLIDEAARGTGLALDLTRAVQEHLAHAEHAGHGDDDMAALFETIRRAR